MVEWGAESNGPKDMLSKGDSVHQAGGSSEKP